MGAKHIKSVHLSCVCCLLNIAYSCIEIQKQWKKSAQAVEVWSYIKNHGILCVQYKDIFDEICSFYGYNEMSLLTVKKFKCRLVFNRRCTIWLQTENYNVKVIARVKEIVASDTRYTARQIASMIGISLGVAHTILKHNLKIRKVCTMGFPIC